MKTMVSQKKKGEKTFHDIPTLGILFHQGHSDNGVQGNLMNIIII